MLQFLLLGGALHLLLLQWPERRTATQIGVAEVQRLRASWQRESGREPSPAEWQASLQKRADDEVLVQEALRQGLDASDPVARQRLVMDWRFTHPGTRESDAQVLAAARSLGLPAQDEVVRRRLIERMEQQLSQGLLPVQAEVDVYIAAHPARYGGLARTRFEQRWLPSASFVEAQAQLAALKAGQVVAGSPWPFGGAGQALSDAELQQRFGAGFAQALAALPAGSWQGPLASPYGLHLVRVQAREPAVAGDAASLRTRAGYALLQEREGSVLRQRLAALRAQHPVQMAALP